MLCFNKMIWFLGYIPELNYAFLIDDVDHLDPLILDDWLPSVLPKVSVLLKQLITILFKVTFLKKYSARSSSRVTAGPKPG